MKSEDIQFLQDIYAGIEEPDGMTGIALNFPACFVPFGAFDLFARFFGRALILARFPSSSFSCTGIAALRSTSTVQEQMRDYESSGQWSEALTCYEQALQQKPDHLPFHIGLLDCLRNLGHLRTAITHVQGRNQTILLRLLLLTSFCSIELTVSHSVGTLSRHPEFASVLSAYGVQAAWRLSQWDLINKEFLGSAEATFDVGVAKCLIALSSNDQQV